MQPNIPAQEDGALLVTPPPSVEALVITLLVSATIGPPLQRPLPAQDSVDDEVAGSGHF